MNVACPQCGIENAVDESVCERCGCRLRCANCGLQIERAPIVSPIGRFCSGCGERIERNEKIDNPRKPSRNNAGCVVLLAISALACGLCGTCFIAFGAGGSDSNIVDTNGFVPFGLFLIAVAAGSIFGIVKLMKK